MFEIFKEWYENRHQYAKEWKERNNNKIIGYFCTYVPEEILYAADIFPIRILGSHEPHDVTEPHIFGMYCPFCRDCLAQGLKGKFNYLDGITISQSCLHIRQAYTSWVLHVPTEFQYYLPMPNKVQSKAALPYLTGELKRFKKAVENWIGKEITVDALKKGTDIVNRNRALMREVYSYRKQDNPALTGLEAMYMVVSSQMVDKEEHNRILESILAKLKERKLERETGTRLMIIGSENDDTEFVKMVESLPATVVVDDHCTGTRYFWNDTKIDGDDILQNIAHRYIDRSPCPSKDWEKRTRLPFILDLAQEYNVQGAILIQQKFCDPHELDIPAIKAELEKNNIPTLFLEFDVTVPVGQFRTRVEAFLEMIGEEDLF